MATYSQLPIEQILNPDNLNLAEYMSEEELTALGEKLRVAFEMDLQSRSKWAENVDEWMKLAVQYKEDKNFPWPKAANIKYPLLTTAAMQFSARAYPSLIVNKAPVKGRIIGPEDAQLMKISDAVAKHMSYQLLEEMDGWENDMDKLFMILPIVGMAYKKTYYDETKDRNVSELILPTDLVVNYWARKLTGYTRKHHVCEMSPNDIYTRQGLGHFRDVELGEPRLAELMSMPLRMSSIDLEMPNTEDETTPYRIVECHCHYDLDGDGYAEPYIVTFDCASSTVLRVMPRFREESIKWSNTSTRQKKILSIEPDEYFTKYGFIPNPDGSFYDLGFGLLLGPINETINTSINQLLDQGTMYTTNGGFLGKGVRIKAGEYNFAPNEWKVLNATTDDLRKSIFQLPVREPSQVLFQMLGSLIEGGEKVASIAEIFVGKMPGQNTPATTTMETVKQGMAVFTAIYKRVYRSLDEEFKKLFKLNQLYLDNDVEYPVELKGDDYRNIKLTVVPTADPDVATDSEKLLKARAQMEFIQIGTVNPKVVTKRVLEAMRVEDIDEVMDFQPPPSPEQQEFEAEVQLKQMDAQRKERESQMKQQHEMLKMELEKMQVQLDAVRAQQQQQQEAQAAQMQLQIEALKAANEQRRLDEEHRNEMQREREAHQHELQQSREEHQMRVEQTKEQGKVKIEQARALGKVKVEMAKKMPKKPKESK
jgi:chaperonin GroES